MTMNPLLNCSATVAASLQSWAPFSSSGYVSSSFWQKQSPRQQLWRSKHRGSRPPGATARSAGLAEGRGSRTPGQTSDLCGTEWIWVSEQIFTSFADQRAFLVLCNDLGPTGRRTRIQEPCWTGGSLHSYKEEGMAPCSSRHCGQLVHWYVGRWTGEADEFLTSAQRC